MSIHSPARTGRDFALEYAELAKSYGASAFIPLTHEYGCLDLLGGRRGTVVGGVTWVDAKAGTKLAAPSRTGRVARFNGTTGYIEFAHNAAYSFAGSFSIVQWVCPEDAANYGETICKGTDWTTAQNYRLTLKSGDNQLAWRDSGNVSRTCDVTASPFSTMTNGTWEMRVASLAATLTSTQAKNENSTPSGYASQDALAPQTNSQVLRIGADPSVPRFWKGLLAYTMLFPGGLSAGQVRTLYRFGCGR